MVQNSQYNETVLLLVFITQTVHSIQQFEVHTIWSVWWEDKYW